jgi:hypothetical protein
MDKIIEQIESEHDYDAGLLNNYGGGNVSWWHDYIRYEIEKCNEYWRELIRSYGENDG